MIRRRRLLSAAALAAAGGLAPAAVAQNAPRAADVKRFLIGAGPVGGTYFPVASLIASLISNPPGGRPCELGGNCGFPNLVAESVTTQGSLENLRRIDDGEFESGLAQADVAQAAARGVPPFAGRMHSRLRAMANLFPETLHIVVRRNAGVGRLSDLRWKRVALGEEGSGTLPLARDVLAAAGLGVQDVEPVTVTPAAASVALREGRLDALFFVAGQPAPLVGAIARQTPIDLLAIPADVRETLRVARPWLQDATFDEGVYEGVPSRTSVAIGAHWIVSDTVDGEIVYGSLRALFHANARAALDRGHPAAASIRLEYAADALTLPLHPGAERFYRDRGVLR